ncbi:MAG: GGDEF domain-containing protein, partial [Sphaerochaetaceae bacterium]|nr:GGDEF domain-containing protein [Sphaerochaetaceae bacterium]
MLSFGFLNKEKMLRRQFSQKINAWNATVLESLVILSILTSALFAFFSITQSNSIGEILFSLIWFSLFLVFKFVNEYSISKDSNKTGLYCIIYWILFLSYVILLNVFIYDQFTGYLFGMIQILLGLVFQLAFVSTFIISTAATLIYLLVSYLVNNNSFEIQEVLIAITSYSFVLLGANIISGTREVELENLSKLEKLSTQDSLTKLLNRRSTQYLIDSQLAEKSTGYLLVIDVDNFKNVNDNQGHLIGDLVLKDLSNTLFQLSPKNSVVGRIGGDEFVVF